MAVGGGAPTQTDGDVIDSLAHGILVVPAIEFGKGGEASCAHPILEMLVLSEVGDI